MCGSTLFCTIVGQGAGLLQKEMFANIATAFLISLGIVLLLFLVTKGIYSRFSPQALHVLAAALVLVASTVAGTVAVSSGKAHRYVTSLASGAKNIAGQADALQKEYGLDGYGLSVSDIAGAYVDGTATALKVKLRRTRTVSFVVVAVLNLLLAFFLFSDAGKARPSVSYGSEDLDDLDEMGGSSSFDDLDLD